MGDGLWIPAGKRQSEAAWCLVGEAVPGGVGNVQAL